MDATDTRHLARAIVEQDLLGERALFDADPDLPAAPRGYRLVRAIGRGGGGAVYLAHDETLDRPVAVKYPSGVSAADVERFRREARFTARLNRASIVQVYEMGEVEGRPYIVMQYLDGGNLAGADLDHAGVARIVRDVATAVGHAHREGIVHRDLKPENILLDRDGRPYVADFGIARDLRSSLGETISHDGQIMGTPALMPPEQARGDITAVDARSDVYALGATLYCKLTGRQPFSGSSLVDVLHAVIHDEPVFPRAYDKDIPRALEAIVVKCMQKVRDDRYASMGEVVDALEKYLSGRPHGADSAAWFRRLVDQRAVAPVPDRAEETDPYWTVGMEVVRKIAAWDADLYRVSGSLEPSFARLDAVETQLLGLLRERPDMAWARFYRGVVLFRRGRLAPALEEMERSIDRVKDLAGAYFELGRLYLAVFLREHQDARKHMSRVGVTESLGTARRRVEQAVVALREAQRLDAEHASWHRDYALAVERLAHEDFAGCVAACDELLECEPDREEVWRLRGDAQRIAGLDCFESYDRALAIRRSYFEVLYAKAEAHLARGQIEDARAALRRGCEIHPGCADIAALLALTYLREARRGAAADALDDGRRHAERALAIDRESYDAAVTLAEIEIERGRLGQGEAWFAPAIAALQQARTLMGCQNRVNFLTAQAQLERARNLRATGGDPRPALQETVRLCEDAGLHLADHEPWKDLRAAAEGERSAS